ncbi:MAG: bifunctional tetrahydrofolate synthase/dihydrofolate synthase [Pseudomonadales bacterium]|nr:bifunctional tetrahydrofolate synthase/dihydrofolate synthase [Pseudomonadales bacterium]
MKNLQQWLDQILQIHPVKWDLGLKRVASVGQRMGVLKPARFVFLVAGTNGKGSTCEFLAQLCQASGLSYGKTTSPFLLDYNEQIVINGNAVEDSQIIASFGRIEEARKDTSLTYFEFGALAALDIFCKHALDVAIIEVGLGGRLDAMNIVDPDISIITRIDIDHEDYLGTDRESIGREKAGIMRRDKPCVLVDPELPNSLMEVAAETGARCYRLGHEFKFSHNRLSWKSLEYQVKPVALPIGSVLAAIQAMLVAGFELSQEIIDLASAGAKLPGRFQHIKQPTATILDVGHNPSAAKYLQQKLLQLTEKPDCIHAVVGMYGDKDLEQVFQILAPHIDFWHLCELETERAASVEEMSQRLLASCGSIASTYGKVGDAYEAAKLVCKDKDLILVFGSFPVVAAALRHLELPAI